MNKDVLATISCGIIIALVGLALLVGAGFLIKQKIVFMSKAVSVIAKITDVKETVEKTSSAMERETYYSPVLRFISQNNQVIETQATWRQADSFLDPKPEKGKTIVLLVNKSDPYSFTKKSFSSLWGWPAMLTFIGLGWLLGGIHMLLRAIKLKGQNS